MSNSHDIVLMPGGYMCAVCQWGGSLPPTHACAGRLCPMCSQPTQESLEDTEMCRSCEFEYWLGFLDDDRKNVISWAQSRLTNRDWVVFDTETTGLLDDEKGDGVKKEVEIVQIGICDARGRTLLDALVKPEKSISPSATAIHHISDTDVADAPTFRDLYPAIRAVLEKREVIVYNVAFDSEVLAQCIAFAGLEPFAVKSWRCAMRLYSIFKEEWDEEREAWRRWTLQKACTDLGIPTPDLHTAIGDCRATIKLIKGMADA